MRIFGCFMMMPSSPCLVLAFLLHDPLIPHCVLKRHNITWGQSFQNLADDIHGIVLCKLHGLVSLIIRVQSVLAVFLDVCLVTGNECTDIAGLQWRAIRETLYQYLVAVVKFRLHTVTADREHTVSLLVFRCPIQIYLLALVIKFLSGIETGCKSFRELDLFNDVLTDLCVLRFIECMCIRIKRYLK